MVLNELILPSLICRLPKVLMLSSSGDAFAAGTHHRAAPPYPAAKTPSTATALPILLFFSSGAIDHLAPRRSCQQAGIPPRTMLPQAPAAKTQTRPSTP